MPIVDRRADRTRPGAPPSNGLSLHRILRLLVMGYWNPMPPSWFVLAGAVLYAYWQRGWWVWFGLFAAVTLSCLWVSSHYRPRRK